MQEVIVSTETIQLDQFLKWINVVGSGGQAKLMIKDEQVKVNDELELRVRRKLTNGDKVEVLGVGIFMVRWAE